MTSHTHDDIQLLLGAYALDSVDPDEAAAIEAHLVHCPKCRAEVADHREVAALLAHPGGDAPAGIWNRIAASLEEAPPAIRLEVRRKRRNGWRGVAITSVAAAALVGLLGAQIVRQNDKIDSIRQEQALEAVANRAIAEPGSRRAELRTDDGETLAVAIVRENGQGYLLAYNLPRLDDHIYQLWGVTPGQVISLGTVGGEPEVAPFSSDGSITQLMITEEKRPVAQATTDPIVVGTLA